MKYLKTFEKYAELDQENYDKVDSLIRDFMKDKKIIDNIDELEFRNFHDAESFEYIAVWENLFNKRANLYSFIESFRDGRSTYCNIEGRPPALYNSMTDILGQLYIEYNIKDKLDKKLIEILEKKPPRYQRLFYTYGDDWNDDVKNACEWMLTINKYNI